jgi:hypothetical protein
LLTCAATLEVGGGCAAAAGAGREFVLSTSVVAVEGRGAVSVAIRGVRFVGFVAWVVGEFVLSICMVTSVAAEFVLSVSGRVDAGSRCRSAGMEPGKPQISQIGTDGRYMAGVVIALPYS